MFRKEKKYLFSFVVIGSILMLSFHNTLSVLHTLLHQIPNPIHYHGEEGLTVYHHTKSRDKSFFAYKNHSHSHSLEDHVHDSQKEKGIKSDQKKKSEKGEKEAPSKTTLFIDHVNSFCFVHTSIKRSLYPNDTFISRIPHSLLGPPPELGT